MDSLNRFTEFEGLRLLREFLCQSKLLKHLHTSHVSQPLSPLLSTKTSKSETQSTPGPQTPDEKHLYGFQFAAQSFKAR